MPITRRELCTLLPTLIATAGATAQTSGHRDSDHHTLPSAIYDLKSLRIEGDKQDEYIPVFRGSTYAGMPVELHETVLAPGAVVHGMYSHPGDELFLVREGIVEVEFAGKRSEVGPGSVAYVASGTVYAVRNTSKQTARYFVFFFGPSHAPINWKPADS